MKNGELLTIGKVTYEFHDSVKCPACGGGMMISMVGASSAKNPVTVYCATGCASEVACEGAKGDDVAHALDILTADCWHEKQKMLAEEVLSDPLEDFVQRMSDSAWNCIASGYRLA